MKTAVHRMRGRCFGMLCGLGLALSAAGAARAVDSGGVFPNDAGPKEIDVSKYPADLQESYHLFLSKCSACHTIARPINSQFIELSADEIAKAKKESPELFKEPLVFKPEDGIWKRYVKRMMSKPGCPVKGKDGERIWKFLVYDSKARKTGANAGSWAEHRRKLLADFKAQHPEEYKKLFGGDKD